MSRSRRIRRFRLASIVCALGAGVLLSVYVCAGGLGLSSDLARWCLVAAATLFAMAMSCQIAYLLKNKRTRAKGRPCVNCGYDLRGNTSGICPECGGLAHYKRSHP